MFSSYCSWTCHCSSLSLEHKKHENGNYPKIDYAKKRGSKQKISNQSIFHLDNNKPFGGSKLRMPSKHFDPSQ